MNELYAPLLERDLASIPGAARAYLETHSEEELWLAIARFAVLAYAPSQHAKRAVMAARAAYELRDELGGRWVEMLVECARYAAEARPPWSEPPILESEEPPGFPTIEELGATAKGDALLMLDAVLALLPLLGEKGKYALLRLIVQELPGEESQVAFDPHGAPDSMQAVFVRAVSLPPRAFTPSQPLVPYPLARDYAQTLLAHLYARRLPPDEAVALLDAVHHNLAHGESYADFSFA